MKKWDDLPELMKNRMVRPYYDILYRHRRALIIKRSFDFFAALILTVLLSPAMLVIAILIRKDSEGPVFFRQKRVTTNGKIFRICKFRTMTAQKNASDSEVTVRNDSRVTEIGRVLRKYRLDELPQLFNCYTDEMRATLLLPAGITSLASIMYKDEEKLLTDAEKADEIYVNSILPEKMKYNLKELEEFSLLSELKIMIATVKAVIID